MNGQLKVVSISYKTAPLAIREQIALNESEVKSLYLKVRDILGLSEIIILSTCNRTEFYYLSEKDESEHLVKLLAIEKAMQYSDLQKHLFVELDESDAITYLFEVATGLHSQVVGDLQIPNQIKNAYQWSADAQMAGPFIHRLMHTVFYVNKRVFQETAFRDGAASTSYAAVETIESFLPSIPNAKILVLGLGEIGKDVAKTLFDKGYKNFHVCNRTLSKSDELAVDLNCEVLPFQDLKKSLVNFDIVISSVAANEPILLGQDIASNSNKKVQYLIDLAIPSSIDKNVEKVAGVVLYGLDEIQQKATKALEKRKEAIPSVKAVIDAAVLEFNDWSNQMVVSPTIQKLKNALETIRQEEMSKYIKSLTKEETAKMEKITASMMQKVMKLPVLQLKAACKRGEAETLIDVLNDLFDLEKVEA